VLNALVKANALCVRPHSVFASDISEQAFANDDVVTAALPIDLHVMGLLEQSFSRHLINIRHSTESFRLILSSTYQCTAVAHSTHSWHTMQ
jgi:hypothetical protein